MNLGSARAELETPPAIGLKQILIEAVVAVSVAACLVYFTG